MYLFDSPGEGLGQPPGPATNCSAIAGDRFDKQPADLKRVLSASFPNPAEWFDGLDRATRIALASIFNRMCRHGVWSHVRRVSRTSAGEAPFMVADRGAPGPWFSHRPCTSSLSRAMR